jgi:hypothetical protein
MTSRIFITQQHRSLFPSKLGRLDMRPNGNKKKPIKKERKINKE